MPIDTKIEGNPDSVRGVAVWLRNSFAKTVSDASTQVYDARNSADAGWDGPASEAFRERITCGAQKTDDLASAADTSAQHLDDYAVGLQRVQEDMARVRSAASGAGLTVDGDLIHEPGPAPPTPGPAPAGASATPDAVSAHNQAVTAQNAHVGLVSAFNSAQQAANTARRSQKFLDDTINNVANDIKTKWFLTIGDLANGAVETLRSIHASTLMAESTRLADDAARYMAQATSASGAHPNTVYRDVDTARTMSQSADDLARESADARSGAGRIAVRAGGALAAAGIVYDVVATDKPVGQAVVSGAGGFAASVVAGAGTGALIGSFVPVPGVGTAVGAVVGAGVGIFTSGAIDSIYENGIGAVGEAFAAGTDAIVNTGEAIGDAAESVGGAIGDTWNAIF